LYFEGLRCRTHHPINGHPKVVNQIFAIEKVVGRHQEVPGQAPEPWQTVYPVDGVADRNYFLETFHLDQERLLTEAKANKGKRYSTYITVFFYRSLTLS
jgi:hypothetical protein